MQWRTRRTRPRPVTLPARRRAVMDTIEDRLSWDTLKDTHVVLVPAWNDALGQPVVPTAPLAVPPAEAPEKVAVHPRVTVVSNPATFVAGGVVFGVTSADVMGNLNRDETTALRGTPGAGPKVDKLPRLLQHLIEQRCFFPIFPPPATDADGGVPLEMLQLWHMGLPLAPDVLLAPSKLLKAFSKPIGATLAVNPGTLTVGSRGGTYARLTIFPPSDAHRAGGTWAGRGGGHDTHPRTTPRTTPRAIAVTTTNSKGDAVDYVTFDVPSRTMAEVVRI